MERTTIRTKGILSITVIFFILFGSFLIIYNEVSRDNGKFRFPPLSRLKLDISNENVLNNGTIRFTTICRFTGDSKPEGEQYLIKYVYIWKEPISFWNPVMEFNITSDGKLDFNKTLGDIQDANLISVITGDLYLEVDEEVRFKFQTLIPLHQGSSFFVGVLAVGPSGLHRWDTNTTVQAI